MTFEPRRKTRSALALSLAAGIGLSAILCQAMDWVVLRGYTPLPSGSENAIPVTLFPRVGKLDLTSDLAECPIHRVPLLTVDVPLIPGLPAGPLPSPLDEQNFPFGKTSIQGGCCFDPFSPTRAMVSQCRECLPLRRAWMIIHRKPSPGPWPGPVQLDPDRFGAPPAPIRPRFEITFPRVLLDPLPSSFESFPCEQGPISLQ